MRSPDITVKQGAKTMYRRHKYKVLLTFFITLLSAVVAQALDVNYDESKVPKYVLPNPLLLADGTKVTDANMWRHRRRPEILRLFEQHVYGKSPGRPDEMTLTVASVDTEAFD
jgi:hypothetical protein